MSPKVFGKKKEKMPTAKIPDTYEYLTLPACIETHRLDPYSSDIQGVIRCSRCGWSLNIPIGMPMRNSDELSHIVKAAFASVRDAGGYVYRDGQAAYCGDCMSRLIQQDIGQKTRPLSSVQANYISDSWSTLAQDLAMAKQRDAFIHNYSQSPIGPPILPGHINQMVKYLGIDPAVMSEPSKPEKHQSEMTVKDHLNEMKRKEKEGIV